MSAWASVVALTGFGWEGVSKTMTFGKMPREGTWFWSNGDAWGTHTQKASDGKTTAELLVGGGELQLKRLAITGSGSAELPEKRTQKAGDRVSVKI